MNGLPMANNFRVYWLLVSVFGLKIRHVGLLLFRIILTLFISVTLCLDSLLFVGFKKQKFEKPLFLIGHLRSGTTFMHRYLSDLLPHYRSMVLWEMVFPALSARKLLTPFLPILIFFSLCMVCV